MAHRVNDGTHDRIGEAPEAVVDPEPFAPGLDETRSAQYAEMSRCLRLGNLETFMDVADADLPGEEESEDPKPCHVRERLEEAFHFR